MKTFVISIFCFMLMGCSALQPRTQMVDKIVTVKCKRQPINDIDKLPFDSATKDMDLYDKVKLLKAENELIKGQNTELKAALEACTQ